MLDPNHILDLNARWRALAQGGGPAPSNAVDGMWRGCVTALEALSTGLEELQYPVKLIRTPPDKGQASRIADIERHTGLEIPAVIKAFWGEVGQVSFAEDGEYAHVDFWTGRGVTAEYCDALVVAGCSADWHDFIMSEFELWQSEGDGDDAFLLALSPDGYHKDDISGGLPYGVCAGRPWLTTWENFDWARAPRSCPWKPVDFVSYLRTAILECAGFPGLLGDGAFEPIRRRLLSDVRPF